MKRMAFLLLSSAAFAASTAFAQIPPQGPGPATPGDTPAPAAEMHHAGHHGHHHAHHAAAHHKGKHHGKKHEDMHPAGQ